LQAQRRDEEGFPLLFMPNTHRGPQHPSWPTTSNAVTTRDIPSLETSDEGYSLPPPPPPHDERRNWRPSYNIQCGNDTTRRDTLSLETSAGHDKGLGGGILRLSQSHPLNNDRRWRAYKVRSLILFFKILFTDYDNSCVMNKEDNDEDSYQR